MFRHNRVVFQDCNIAESRRRSEAAHAARTDTQWIGKLLSMFRESIRHFSYSRRWRTCLGKEREKKHTHILYIDITKLSSSSTQKKISEISYSLFIALFRIEMMLI